MAVLVASVVLLYVLFLALAVLVIVLYRQFGLVYVGSRRSFEMAGPDVGDIAPTGLSVVGRDNPDLSLALEWQKVARGRGTLLLFGGESCPLCGHVLRGLDEYLPAEADGARVLYVEQGSGASPGVDLPRPGSGRWEHWRSPDGSVHRAFDAQVSPFAVAIDAAGVVRGKAIVSEPLAVRSLMEQAGLTSPGHFDGGPDLSDGKASGGDVLAANKGNLVGGGNGDRR